MIIIGITAIIMFYIIPFATISAYMTYNAALFACHLSLVQALISVTFLALSTAVVIVGVNDVTRYIRIYRRIK